MEPNWPIWSALLLKDSCPEDEGEVRRNRRAVHFCTYLGATARGGSSCHNDSDLFVLLNWKKWLRDGKDIYLAPNGVPTVYGTVHPTYIQTMVCGYQLHPHRLIENNRSNLQILERYLVDEFNWTPYQWERKSLGPGDNPYQ